MFLGNKDGPLASQTTSVVTCETLTGTLVSQCAIYAKTNGTL